MQNMLRDYSIELTESDDFDYAFLGADDILDKSPTVRLAANPFLYSGIKSPTF